MNIIMKVTRKRLKLRIRKQSGDIMLLMFWIWIQTKTSAVWLEILGKQALWSLRVLQIWNVFPTKLKTFLSTARLNVALNYSSNYIPYMDVKMGIMFLWCLCYCHQRLRYDQMWDMLHYMCRERGLVFSPETVHIDFEMAMHNSVRRNFK